MYLCKTPNLLFLPPALLPSRLLSIHNIKKNEATICSRHTWRVCAKSDLPPKGSVFTTLLLELFVCKCVGRWVPLPPAARELRIPAIKSRPSLRPAAVRGCYPSAISLWVWYLSFPTLCAYSLALRWGTIEVCLVTHHISYGVWSPVEGEEGEGAASARPSGLAY